MIRLIPLFISLIFLPIFSDAQCDFTPTVQGDTLLCPNSTGTLHTGLWDTVQWYRRSYSGDEPEPIPGATDTAIQVGPDDILNWYSVEVTHEGCTERSGEVLVDGLAFLLPHVVSTGEFGVGDNGETILCNGDSVVFTFSYTANVQWFRNGAIIPGATDSSLVVYEGGFYTAQGAPQRCPNYIQSLGLNLEVIKKDRDAVQPEIRKRNDVVLELVDPHRFDRVRWYWEDSLLLFNQDTIHPQRDGRYRLFSEDHERCPEWSNTVHWNVTAIDRPGLPDGSIYPQPADQLIRLDLPAELNWTDWQLFDARARMVKHGMGTDDIRVGSLSSGWYVLRIKGNGTWHYSKILISR